MADEEKQRKVSVPSIERVVKAISEGAYDESISEIQVALDKRRDVLKEQVLERVRRIYGEDAEIVVSKDSHQTSSLTEKRNPFVQKAEREGASESEHPTLVDPVPLTASTADEIDENRITDDPLDNVNGEAGLPMNEVERRMASGEQIVDIEHRGAIIGGMSASQMGN